MTRATTPSRVTTIDAQVGGAALRLVIGGAPAPRGESFVARARSLARRAEPLRRLVMREPRGHHALVGAMFVDPGPDADAGLVFMDAQGWLPLCGHGLIGAVTIAVERGVLSGRANDPDGRPARSRDETTDLDLRLETLAGTIGVQWTRAGARVTAVTYRGPAATVVAASIPLEVGTRHLRADAVDVAGRYLVVDGEASGARLDLAAEADLVRVAQRIEAAYEATPLAKQSGVALDAVVFVGPPATDDADVRCGVVHAGGVLDRGPSGGAAGALCALLDAMGAVADGYMVTVEGPSGGRLYASVAQRVSVDGLPGIVPAIRGTAAITGDHVFYGDPEK